MQDPLQSASVLPPPSIQGRHRQRESVLLPVIVAAPDASGSGIVVGRQILLVVAFACGLAAVHLERGLDKLFEHRVRLAICTLLAQTDAINFARFKSLLEQSDGSLGAQLRKPEKAGYIRVNKRFEQRKPVSGYSLGAAGRKALKAHLHALGAITSLVPVPKRSARSP